MLKMLLGPIGLACLLYASTVYLFLNSPLGPAVINRHPEKFQLHWSSGAMWIPGEIELRGLQLKGRTRKGNWQVDIDQAHLTVDIPSLKQRIFRLSRADARSCGVLWQSHTSESQKAGHLGPLQEKDDHEQAASEKHPGKAASKWKFVFDGIEIDDLRQIKLDKNLLNAGSTPGSGFLALSFQPRGPITVPKVSLALSQGNILIADQNQGEFDHLRIQGSLDPFVPRQHQGTE